MVILNINTGYQTNVTSRRVLQQVHQTESFCHVLDKKYFIHHTILV